MPKSEAGSAAGDSTPLLQTQYDDAADVKRTGLCCSDLKNLIFFSRSFHWPKGGGGGGGGNEYIYESS